MEENTVVADNVFPYYSKTFESQLVKELSIISILWRSLAVVVGMKKPNDHAEPTNLER